MYGFVKWLRRHKSGLGHTLALLTSLAVALYGWAALESGEPGYRNYWGGFVGAWTALGIGFVGVGGTIWSWLSPGSPYRRRPEKKLKGRAARRARQAERHRSAIDDFDRPWTGGR